MSGVPWAAKISGVGAIISIGLVVLVCVIYLIRKFAREVEGFRAEEDILALVRANVRRGVPKLEILRGMAQEKNPQEASAIVAAARGATDEEVMAELTKGGSVLKNVDLVKLLARTHMDLIETVVKQQAQDPSRYPMEAAKKPQRAAAEKADGRLTAACACGKKYLFPREKAGKVAVCGACKARFRIPES